MSKENYEQRINELRTLDDEALYKQFWTVTNQLLSPLVEIAHTHTTPSIERSVLLRMGFNSLQATAFVERCIQHGKLGAGAGAILYNYAQRHHVSYWDAFEQLMLLDRW